MKQHLNIKRTGSNNSWKRDLDVVSKRIEATIFITLSLFFLATYRVNKDFSNKISFAFVDISLPVAQIAAAPFNIAINILTNFHELSIAKEENIRLKAEMETLKSFYIRSLDIHEENKELREILKFVNSRSSNFQIAKVVGASHRVFNQKVFVNAGSDHNVKEGSIVTGSDGVIGRISEVGTNKSRLILVTDASSHIPVITSKSRVRGILAGNGSSLMDILYLPKDHSIQEGDRVFTSGDGDILPPGLLIGVVKEVKEDSVKVSMVESADNVDIATIISYDSLSD